MIASIPRHLRHHIRFYSSAVIGLILWFAMGRLVPGMRLVAAGDGFFAAYLGFVTLLACKANPDFLRRRASSDDEGIAVIVVITLVAIVLSFYSIFNLLSGSSAPDAMHLILAIIGVPLGWFTLHTVMAFHYAHLFYGQTNTEGGKRVDVGGLAFPGGGAPTVVDFLYYSFVVAMTAQVSDVQVVTTEMRRLTLIHGIASFLLNNVIRALAGNGAAGLSH
jgi:uncharacterized membrane protein